MKVFYKGLAICMAMCMLVSGIGMVPAKAEEKATLPALSISSTEDGYFDTGIAKDKILKVVFTNSSTVMPGAAGSKVLAGSGEDVIRAW